MTEERRQMSAMGGIEFDVIVIGGGPAGAVVASLLALANRRVLVIERDIHPRDHVGESLTPSTNPIFARIRFLEKKDPHFNQFGIYSWFRGVEPNPTGFEGFLFLHFLGLERAWAWQIPLRDGVCSVGVVTEKEDFNAAHGAHDLFFESLVARSKTFAHNMRNARRIRPWWLEGDFSYEIDRLAGDGWLLVGDALRFVDPIFSTGVDVAAYSAL